MIRYNPRTLLAIGLLLLPLTLAGCASSSGLTRTTATTADCVNWKDISYSEIGDSPATVQQIIESNARRDAECKAPDAGGNFGPAKQ